MYRLEVWATSPPVFCFLWGLGADLRSQLGLAVSFAQVLASGELAVSHPSCKRGSQPSLPVSGLGI